MERFISYIPAVALAALLSGCIGGDTPDPLPPEEEIVIELKRPMGVAVDGMDRRIIANTGMDQVLVLDKDYNPEGIITGEAKGGRLREPHGVATDSRNRIIVADTGNNCVKIYSEKGIYKKTIGEKGSGPGQFNRPEGVATDSYDNIFVFDTGNKRVQVFNSGGRYIFEFNSGEYSYERLKGKIEDGTVEKIEGTLTLDHPVRGTAMPGNRLVIADYYAGKYSVWEYDVKSKAARVMQFVEPMNNYEDYLAGDVAYNPVQNELFYIRSGFPLTNVNFLRVAGIDKEEFEKVPEEQRRLKDDPYEWTHFYRTNGALKTRFFEPRGVAVDSKGNAVIALARQNRVLEYSRYEIEERIDRLHPLTMRIVNTRRGSFTIEYDTYDKVQTRLEYGRMPDGWLFGDPPPEFEEYVLDRATKKHHRVEVYDLFPATRYIFRYVSSNRSFPRESFTNPFVASTEPNSGRSTHLDLPITVLLFTNIVIPVEEDKLPKDDEGKPIHPDDPGEMTEEQVFHFKEQLAAARLFYWVNSHLKMNMKFNYILDDTRYEGLPFEKRAYFSDKDRKKLDEILRGHGVEPKGIGGGVCVVYGIRKYDYEKGEWFMPGSGGNTWGLPHDGSGISVWNAGGGNAWLFAHEYGHQLGIMGNNCGHIFHFNHFHWNDLPGDYGSHWDGNAYIAREFKASSYLANFYGSLAISTDSDNDGIPDDDPSVPLDEKRLGTKPYSPDSDNDGLRDLDEVMAAMWLFDLPTIGGRMVGPVYRPVAFDIDSDDDGISDGRDPYPLYAFSTRVAKNTVTVDGEMTEQEWANNTKRVIVDEKVNGSFHVNWDDKYLYFGLAIDAKPESKQPPLMRIEIDGNNDGYTVGSDNVEIKVSWNGDTEDLEVNTRYNDTSVRKKPVWTKNINPIPEDVLIAWKRVGETWVVELGVPQTPEAGLNLFSGEEIGFSLSFKPDWEKDWLMIFEPQELVDVTLE